MKNEVIRLSTDILLPEGISQYEIDASRDITVTFRNSGNSQAFIRILNSKKLTIRTFTKADTEVSYLFWNSKEDALDVEESHEVMGNAYLGVSYGECNGRAVSRNVYAALREEGAEALLSTAALVDDKYNCNMRVVNFAPHTYGDMKNYAVVLKDGRLMIDAVGQIVHGAHGSESHQTSRALSFEEGQKAEILPELLIDENDVQASHAMSMGRVDDEQLFYLMSRGLTVQQCTALISTGYLMPVTETIENEDLKKILQEEMERKISGICSMQ